MLILWASTLIVLLLVRSYTNTDTVGKYTNSDTVGKDLH